MAEYLLQGYRLAGALVRNVLEEVLMVVTRGSVVARFMCSHMCVFTYVICVSVFVCVSVCLGRSVCVCVSLSVNVYVSACVVSVCVCLGVSMGESVCLLSVCMCVYSHMHISILVDVVKDTCDMGKTVPCKPFNNH